MNILEIEDALKGAPDDYLMKEAQNPSGIAPQYLVVSEIQRRQDMRKRYEGTDQSLNTPTITEQILKDASGQGIAAQQPAMQKPQQPSAQPVQGYSGGGQVDRRGRGKSPVGIDFLDPKVQRFLEIKERNPFMSDEEIYEALGISPNNPVSGPSGEIRAEGAGLASDIANPDIDMSYLLRPRDRDGFNPYDYMESQTNTAMTGPPLSMEEITEREGSGNLYDQLIAMGGDDSINEDIQGIMARIPYDASSQDFLDRMEGRLGEFPGLSSSYERLIQETAQRERQRAAEIEERSRQRQETLGKDAQSDALAQAMISLGAGIAGNDLSGGLRDAGEKVQGIRTMERQESLEEQRYSDATTLESRRMADQQEIGLEAERMNNAIEGMKQDIMIDTTIGETEIRNRTNAIESLRTAISAVNSENEGEATRANILATVLAEANDRLREIAELDLAERETVESTKRVLLQSVPSLVSSYVQAAVDQDAPDVDRYIAGIIYGLGAKFNVPLTELDVRAALEEYRAGAPLSAGGAQSDAAQADGYEIVN